MKGIEKIGGWFGKKAEDIRKKPAEAPAKEIEYMAEELKELEPSMISAVEKIKDAIDGEEYDALIGDDASGRIPTLVLREVMRQRMEKMHPDLEPEEKRKKLQTYFVAGGRRPGGISREEKEENKWLSEQLDKDLADFFEKIKPDIKRRALFVTEHISTGESLAAISKLMEKAGIPFDIVSARAEATFSGTELENEAERGHKTFIGGFGEELGIYKKNRYSGVVKNRQRGELNWPRHAKPFFTMPYHSYARKMLRETRDDAKMMADKIVKEVWKGK